MNCVREEYIVYDKTVDGENFRGFCGFDSTANVFPRIFPFKFFSNSIASSCSLFLVVQIMALYKESFAHIVNSKPYERANKEAPGKSIGNLTTLSLPQTSIIPECNFRYSSSMYLDYISLIQHVSLICAY